MRLDKFTIGSGKPPVNGVDRHRFKNLKNVTVDFDEDEWITVVIGWNGTGKSNVLEALAALFRDLITGKDEWNNAGKPSFAYILKYRCHGKEIEINADPDRNKDAYNIRYRNLSADEIRTKRGQPSLFKDTESEDKLVESITYPQFKKVTDEFLPRYVFGYYSGTSDRMQSVFRPYLQQYDKKLRNVNSEDPGMRRLFYALPVHSQFVLLAFVLQQDDVVREFLDHQLGLDMSETAESIDSVLMVLNEPPWNRNKSKEPKGKYNARKENPDIFWGAEGVVRSFLDRVHKVSTAPIKISRKDDSSFWNKSSREYLYLFIKDIEALAKLVGPQTPSEFFRDLESTYVSELIKEIRIRIKLKKNDGSVTFKELSEGEQQLLTVLGLLRFTAEEESLFLLDEPDTHLNPKWCVDYISYLKKFINTNSETEASSHIILTTHNPLSIAELTRNQVQILNRDRKSRAIQSKPPADDPLGMGYAAIVTSDMFGIASSLDPTTQKLLEEQRHYASKDELSDDDKRELDNINAKLDRFDFRYFHSNDEYSRYIRLRDQKLRRRFGVEKEAKVTAVLAMSRDEREILAKEVLDELFIEESDQVSSKI